MGNLRYIRHLGNQPRVSSDSTDVFVAPLPAMVPYRDVVKLYSVQNKEESYTYTIGKCLFPADFEASSAMDRWILCVVAEGRLRGMGRSMGRGDWLFVPASVPHVLRSYPGETPLYYWCTTNDPLLEPGMRTCGIFDAVMAGHIDRMDTLSQLFEEMIYRETEAVDRRLWFCSTMLRILACASGDTEAATEKVPVRLYERCISYVEYRQGKLTVEELADTYHVSRQYLHHVFLRYGGISPQKCILDTKMRAADKYLLTTDLSIAQIAEMMCYNNYNHFTQTYKKYFGILPSERRKQNANSKQD